MYIFQKHFRVKVKLKDIGASFKDDLNPGVTTESKTINKTYIPVLTLHLFLRISFAIIES